MTLTVFRLLIHHIIHTIILSPDALLSFHMMCVFSFCKDTNKPSQNVISNVSFASFWRRSVSLGISHWPTSVSWQGIGTHCVPTCTRIPLPILLPRNSRIIHWIRRRNNKTHRTKIQRVSRGIAQETNRIFLCNNERTRESVHCTGENSRLVQDASAASGTLFPLSDRF